MNTTPQEERKETLVQSCGKDELYCEFWRCLSCDYSEIPAGSNYCGNCGLKIKKEEEICAECGLTLIEHGNRAPTHSFSAASCYKCECKKDLTIISRSMNKSSFGKIFYICRDCNRKRRK